MLYFYYCHLNLHLVPSSSRYYYENDQPAFQVGGAYILYILMLASYHCSCSNVVPEAGALSWESRPLLIFALESTACVHSHEVCIFHT